MNTTIQNPERALDMVVSASLEDCVMALHSLEKGGWFAREKVSVKTRRGNNDLHIFEVKLKIARGKSRSVTTLRGTLHYDDYLNTTTIMGEVPSVMGKMILTGGVVGLFVVVLLLPMMISMSSVPFFILILLAILPFSLWMMYVNDMNDTQKLLQMTERVLRLTANKKGHRYAGLNSDDSPFYEDEP
ncbi:MAG: hypothetical protein RLP44_11215 [Aggregatilineales bacterium]